MNINKPYKGEKSNILKIGLISVGIAFSLNSALAQTDTTYNANMPDEKVQQIDNEKQQIIDLLNNQLLKVNDHTYQVVANNIKGFMASAYNVDEDKIFMKRGVVPYKVDLYIKNFVLEYKDKILYTIKDIIEENGKIYIIVKGDIIVGE